MRNVVRFIDFASIALVAWIFMVLIPLQWFWFDPGEVVISNTTVAAPPKVSFTRTIQRRVLMTYQVVVRDIEKNRVICDPSSEAFSYSPTAQMPDDADLVWWTGGDDRCWPQEPGTYVAETCWTAVSLFFGMVPDKTVCRLSNPFTVAGISREEAAETVEQTRGLKLQVEEIQREQEVIQRQLQSLEASE